MPNIPLVEGNFDLVAGLPVGEPIAVVAYTDETARLTHAEVVQHDPLVVRILESDSTEFHADGRVMLIVKGKTPPWRARTTVASVDIDGGNPLVKFNDVAWEPEDRRRYTRFAVEVPVELKLVHEQQESLSFTEAKGRTLDLSLGGAAIYSETTVPVGTLVEFRWTPANGKPVRSLAVVMHHKERAGCIGIEFVNFIGEGRTTLEQLLAQAA